MIQTGPGPAPAPKHRSLSRPAHVAAFLLMGLVGTSACNDDRHATIRKDIHVVATRDDGLTAPAMQRLIAHGPPALAHIESAMHSADTPARLRFVKIIGAIATVDAMDLTRHWALYDPESEVRQSCEALLARWAPQDNERARKARAAQNWLEDQRRLGHGPITKNDRLHPPQRN